MNRNSSIQHEGDVLARSVKQLMLNRRQIICTGGALLASPFLALRQARAAAPSLRLTGVELLPIRATARTVWLFVRLRADNGLSGLGIEMLLVRQPHDHGTQERSGQFPAEVSKG